MIGVGDNLATGETKACQLASRAAIWTRSDLPCSTQYQTLNVDARCLLDLFCSYRLRSIPSSCFRPHGAGGSRKAESGAQGKGAGGGLLAGVRWRTFSRAGSLLLYSALAVSSGSPAFGKRSAIPFGTRIQLLSHVLDGGMAWRLGRVGDRSGCVYQSQRRASGGVA